MGFFSFIGGMLGGAKADAESVQAGRMQLAGVDAVRGLISSAASTGTIAIPVEADTSIYESAAGLILFREAILDTKNRLCGYRFLLRSALAQGVNEIHHIHDRDPLFFKLLQQADVAGFAARRMAVLPLHPRSLEGGRFRYLAGQHTVFLIDLRQVDMPMEELIAHIKELRQSGCQVAFTGFLVDQHTPRLLLAADMLYLQLDDYSLLEFQGLVGRIRNACPNLALVVENIPSWTEQRMCLALGAKYCLGSFISSADKEEEQSGVMMPGRLTSIEMLNLLRQEAATGALSMAAKKDPAITVQLLKWANSPLAGLRTPVTNLDQAIVVLGRETLYRWLTMSIFRMGGANKERDESLLEVALTRARFLETVEAPDLTPESRDELFLVGMLSLFEVLLAMPMDKILAEMNLSPEIADVLLHSSGPYGRYLRLALVMEKGRAPQIAELAEAIGISMDGLESTNLSAFNWAQEALGGMNAPATTSAIN